MAKNIQRYMDLQGKSRQDVCEALNVKYSTFSEWVNGSKYPRIDSIELMANYFGIKKSDLIEDHSDRQVQEDEQYRHLKELAAKMEEDDENGVVILRAKGKSQKSYRIPEEKITLLEMLAKELMEDDD